MENETPNTNTKGKNMESVEKINSGSGFEGGFGNGSGYGFGSGSGFGDEFEFGDALRSLHIAVNRDINPRACYEITGDMFPDLAGSYCLEKDLNQSALPESQQSQNQ